MTYREDLLGNKNRKLFDWSQLKAHHDPGIKHLKNVSFFYLQCAESE